MKKLWGRRPSPAMIVAILALSVSVAGTAVAAGVFSKQEKKVIKKLANKKITKRAGSLSVARADFAENVLAATVPVGDSCVITNQTGGISAVDAGATKCDVTFPRSVANCSVGATPLHPTGDFAGEAEIRYVNGPTVRVGRFDGAGGTPTRGLFSIFAVCPA